MQSSVSCDTVVHCAAVIAEEGIDVPITTNHIQTAIQHSEDLAHLLKALNLENAFATPDPELDQMMEALDNALGGTGGDDDDDEVEEDKPVPKFEWDFGASAPAAGTTASTSTAAAPAAGGFNFDFSAFKFDSSAAATSASAGSSTSATAAAVPATFAFNFAPGTISHFSCS